MKNYWIVLWLGLAESIGLPALYFIRQDALALYFGGVAAGIMVFEIVRICLKSEQVKEK